MLKPTNVVVINRGEDNMYAAWLKLLSPLHKMTDKEIDIASLFIDKYIKAKKDVTNDDLLNQITFSTDTKREIRNAFNMSPTYFQIIMKGLKDKHFFIDGKINKKYVPSFSDDGNILLMYIIKP